MPLGMNPQDLMMMLRSGQPGISPNLPGINPELLNQLRGLGGPGQAPGGLGQGLGGPAQQPGQPGAPPQPISPALAAATQIPNALDEERRQKMALLMRGLAPQAIQQFG